MRVASVLTTGMWAAFPHGSEVADALLDGAVLPDDAPPGYREIAALVHRAKESPDATDPATEAVVVASMLRSIGEATPAATNVRRRPATLRRVASVKVLAVAFAVAGGGMAAAATGSFPAPVQRTLAQGFSHIGISIPRPTDTPAPTPVPTTAPPTTSPSLPTSTAPNLAAACVAFLSSPSGGQGSGESAASGQLVAAAQANGETVSQFCSGSSGSDTTPSSTVQTPPVSTTPATNPAGKTPGPPDTNPAGNTPGPPATNPAGNTPGPPATNPAGKTPGSPDNNPPGNPRGPEGNPQSSTPDTNPAGNTPGPPAVNPAGKTPGSPKH